MRPETLARFMAFAARLPEISPGTQLTAGPLRVSDYEDEPDENPGDDAIDDADLPG